MMCRLATIVWAISICVLYSHSSKAQDSPVITAENIEQLASVSVIRFDNLPERAGEIINGRVYISDNGDLLAVVNRDGQAVLLDDGGSVLAVADVILTKDGFPATFIDGVFADDGALFASIHTAGDRYFVSFVTLQGEVRMIEVQSANKPVAIWLDGEVAWLEVVPIDPNTDPYLVQVPLPESQALVGAVSEAALTILPFAPADDADIAARIGRLPPPLAITVTESVQVKRWNLQTGALTSVIEVAEIPIYGHATADGDWLLWRDSASSALHLLNFSSGDDRVVAELNAVYIPFLFLAPAADVAIGVYENDSSSVIAWDMRSGKRHELGLFRHCQRPPDMVRLSLDGTTLVIGCDTGLDVWRVQN